MAKPAADGKERTVRLHQPLCNLAPGYFLTKAGGRRVDLLSLADSHNLSVRGIYPGSVFDPQNSIDINMMSRM
jgi:hypothetical protein